MVHPFERMQKDMIFIQNFDGIKTGPHKTSVTSNGKVTIFDGEIDVEEGYKIIRPLPNGKEEAYTVLKSTYKQSFSTMPAHYDLELEKDNALLGKGYVPMTNINISNSQGVQVGDNNSQSIVSGIENLIYSIKESDITLEEKAKAKSKVKELLENPAVAAVLGSTVAGLLAML